ncbi:MAG TPA: hypothetical protein VK897_00300 [Anaerolineales bacterium]|nr:hypothetical protein [Anaerolineales bacterium]
MDNPLTPEKQDILIEDALHTYPVVSMPRDLTLNVMARIQSVPMPRPFRLAWLDLVLALILLLCAGAIWFSVQNLPPVVVAQIRKESILFYQYMLVNAGWLIPVVPFTLAGFFAALTIPYLRQELMKNSA